MLTDEIATQNANLLQTWITNYKEDQNIDKLITLCNYASYVWGEGVIDVLAINCIEDYCGVLFDFGDFCDFDDDNEGDDLINEGDEYVTKVDGIYNGSYVCGMMSFSEDTLMRDIIEPYATFLRNFVMGGDVVELPNDLEELRTTIDKLYND